MMYQLIALTTATNTAHVNTASGPRRVRYEHHSQERSRHNPDNEDSAGYLPAKSRPFAHYLRRLDEAHKRSCGE